MQIDTGWTLFLQKIIRNIAEIAEKNKIKVTNEDSVYNIISQSRELNNNRKTN